MLTTLKNRNFALLWVGGLISMIGNWILLAALPFHIYAVTGSAIATSSLLIAYIAPGIVFGSVAGVFVDRWDRKRTMVVVSLLQTAVLLVMLLARSNQWLWVIYVVAFIESSLGQFFSPAENALLPTLVGEDRLASANALNSLNDNIARLIGPAIGGMLLAGGGFTTVVVLDALSYGITAVLVALVIVERKPKAVEAVTTAGSAWLKVWQEWLAGLKLVRGKAILANLFLIVGLALFGDAILSAILVIFVQDSMGLGSTEFGWMMTARGIGGLIGGLLIGQLGSKLPSGKVIGWGLALSGVIILGAINFPIMSVVLPLLTLVGVVAIAAFVSVQTLLQQATPDEYRGRIFGAFGTTINLLMVVGSALGGFTADRIGALPLMNGASLIYIVAGGLALLLLREQLLPAAETLS